jgi:mannose-6-phosphate isomerase-like protein (cupin superfamily)
MHCRWLISLRPLCPSKTWMPSPCRSLSEAGGLYIGSFVGLTPWENHPHTDELLCAVEGEVEVTLLTEAGPQTELLRQGGVCIVPQDLWHRQLARQPVKLLTISGDAQISWADDPRVP